MFMHIWVTHEGVTCTMPVHGDYLADALELITNDGAVWLRIVEI